MRLFRRRRPIPFTGSVLALTLFTSGCHPVAVRLGANVEAAARNGDSLFTAFARRFTRVQRDAKFAHARPLMGKYALTPARLYEDTSIWIAANNGDSTRGLFLMGSSQSSGYLFQARSDVPYPTRVGDERHFMQLKRTGEDDYEWYTIVDHAIGPVRAREAGAAMRLAFTAFEGRTGDDARMDARTTFPRAALHLGQLIAIDSLVTVPNADGSTSARFVLRIRPDSVRQRYPNYAAYLDKYLVPSRFRLQLHDRNGGTFLDADGRDGRSVIRLRSRDGKLVTLDGLARPMPDSLQMRIDFSAKFKIFRVGYTNLVADFTLESSEHERAWMWRFRKEPDWHFPLAFDKLIKTPLRRPFEGRGAEFRLGIRDDLGAEAMSYRVARVAVRESTIMRWLGGLGATAFGDFANKTEIEENRFLAELFTALQQDVAALR
ncbi:MAG: hypothetical protein ABI877_13750 [Gemmatimonadaceae bacterium]